MIPKGNRPTVSVIIPSGRPDQVTETVTGLKNQDFDHQLFEILIVSPVFFKHQREGYPEIRTVQTDRLYPPGKMRNLGAAAAGGHYLAFIDDDCIPPSNWLPAVLPKFQNRERIAAVGCRVVALKKTYWSRAADYALFSAYQYLTPRIIALGSAAIIFKRSCFEKANGFDETLEASEDWDICLKLQAKGYYCLFDPEVEVRHRHGYHSFLSILKKSYLFGIRSRLVVQTRHKGALSWLARLSVAMKSPWLYWILVGPYALLVSILQGFDFFRKDRRILLHFPVVLTSRIAYHVGVFTGLLRDYFRTL